MSKKTRTTSVWIPLDTLLALEDKTASDLLHLCDLDLLPPMQLVDGEYFVNMKVLPDWRALLSITGFVSTRQMMQMEARNAG